VLSTPVILNLGEMQHQCAEIKIKSKKNNCHESLEQQKHRRSWFAALMPKLELTAGKPLRLSKGNSKTYIQMAGGRE